MILEKEKKMTNKKTSTYNSTRWGLQTVMRVLLLVLIIFLPFTVFGKDIQGSGWLFYDGEVDKRIILFEKDGTFTYLNLVMVSGNEGEVYSESDETWFIDEDKVVLSFTDGYYICSLTLNRLKDRMSGTCINKKGLVEQVRGQKIE